MSAAPSTFEISLCAPPSEKLEQSEINRQTQLSFENSLSAPACSSSTWQTFWSTTTLSQFAPFHAVSQNSKGHFLKVLILSGKPFFPLAKMMATTIAETCLCLQPMPLACASNLLLITISQPNSNRGHSSTTF